MDRLNATTCPTAPPALPAAHPSPVAEAAPPPPSRHPRRASHRPLPQTLLTLPVMNLTTRTLTLTQLWGAAVITDVNPPPITAPGLRRLGFKLWSLIGQ
jgi:hypothetical protein